jgi:hypothetical protein
MHKIHTLRSILSQRSAQLLSQARWALRIFTILVTSLVEPALRVGLLCGMRIWIDELIIIARPFEPVGLVDDGVGMSQLSLEGGNLLVDAHFE